MKPYVLQFISADEELATCDKILTANFWIFGISPPWKFHQSIGLNMVLSRIASIPAPKVKPLDLKDLNEYEML